MNVTKIERVAVIGTGTMGRGIAQVVAMAGMDVLLFDTNNDAISAAFDEINVTLEKGVSLGKVSADVKKNTLERLSGTNTLSHAVCDAQVIIEAIPEIMALKQGLFADIESLCSETTLLATNTSSLSVTELAQHCSDSSRFIGLHFFNPVHLMRLLEVIHHEHVPQSVINYAVAFGKRLGKNPIVVRDAPGFASTRLGVVIGLEAIRMVEEGVASPRDIDKAMTLGYGHKTGPLEVTDLIGLDVRLDIATYLSKSISKAFNPPQLLRQKVSEGKLGQKTGEGFYVWRGDTVI